MSEGADVQDTFVALLDKSFSLFAGLRDLPPFGQRYLPYFQKTFEVYTRLWYVWGGEGEGGRRGPPP